MLKRLKRFAVDAFCVLLVSFFGALYVEWAYRFYRLYELGWGKIMPG